MQNICKTGRTVATITARCGRMLTTLLLMLLTTTTARGVISGIDKVEINHGSFTISGWLMESYDWENLTIHFWLTPPDSHETVDSWYVTTSIPRERCGNYIVNGKKFGYTMTREIAPGKYELHSLWANWYIPFFTTFTVKPYQYFATFHTDHGTAPDDLPIPDNISKPLPLITCEGYTFVCWNTSQDGTGENISSVTNQSIDAYARWLPGSGTAEDPWRITSQQDWDVFRVLCNSNESAVSLNESSHVRLETDLTITETLNSYEVFQGEFDGNGHTITINAGSSSAIGLFHTATDCYIHDLKVEGAVVNSNAKTEYMGGLAGRIVTTNGYLGNGGNGRSLVENCTVSVDLVPNTTSANCPVGGFIGRQENSNAHGVTFTNCEFNGSMPSSGNCTAGFVGASSSNLLFQDCIFAPRQMVQTPAYTFSDSYALGSEIFYSEPGQVEQGQQICTYLPTVGVYQVLQTAFANRYYLRQSSVGINGLAASYAYTGSPITVTFTVSKDNATLATDAYTAVIRNAAGEAVASVQDLGLYTLEVTIPNVGTYARSFYVTGPLTQTDGVYLINSLADWTRFADDVASGFTYSGAIVRLCANITTETMVGTEAHPFSGTFDGNHHTLTFNYMSYKTVYDATENYRAPFRYISGATIRDLTVAGTTSSTGQKMGGLVAYASGNNSITGCTVSATLISHLGGDASNGGFIAHVQNGSTSFTSCVFNGYLISGPSCRCNGGFVGWSGGELSFTDCLFNPAAMVMPSTESSTFARCNDVTFTDTYYTTTLGVAQGVWVSMSPQDCIGEKKTMTNGTEVYVIHGTSIEGLAATYPYNSDNDVTLDAVSVKYNGTTLSANKYTITIRNSAGDVVNAPTAAGQYTLTAAGNNDEGYYGSLSQPFMVVTTLATDESGYYLVSDANDWTTLDYEVKNNPSFTGSKVKLTDDLSVTTMIGDGSHPFSSTFDGDGHTLTVNLSGGGTVAPFPFVSNATFINLHVAGSVSSTAPETWTGGLIGEVLGNVEITACRSSVNVTGTGQSMAGGFVATGGWAENRSISMRNCLFDGTLSGDLNFASGFVGDYYTTWSSSTLALINCLMDGTIDTSQGRITEVGPFYCYAFSPTLDYYTITNCYHRFASQPTCKKYYSNQGFYTTSSGTELRDDLGGGWTLDGDDVVPAMAQLNTRCITVTPGIEHGTVECMASNVPGQSVTVTVIPDDGYETTSVSYNDGTDHAITPENGLYRFTMPEADVTVSVTFSLSPNAIPYMAYNTTTDKLEQRMHVSPTALTNSTDPITLGTEGNETWYIVNSDVTAESRMTVNGTVHLILADDATLTAVAGITVHRGNTLNIYGQAESTGAIVATVVDAGGNYAAIGTEDNGGDPEEHIPDPKVLGTINIHGGHITATGGAWSAGIGGGVGGGGGTINIYGGTISATGNNGDAQAIGRGSSGAAVTRIIVDGLCVYRNNNSTPDGYNNRIGGLDQQIVRVEPCIEHNFVNNICTYCGLYHHYELSYNANGAAGGIVPPTATILSDGDRIATVSGNVGNLERAGYSFAGWNTEADGSGTAYEANNTFVISEMVTLYAQWDIVTYTITYNLDGGTLPEGQSNPVSYTIESRDITLVNPTKTDCYFMGWSGTGIQGTSKSVTIPAGSIGHRSYTVTWDDNTPPFAGMEIDHDFNNNPDEVGRYFVKMPAPIQPTGDWVYDEELGDYVEVMNPADEDFPIRTVTIPDGFATTFKVYDSGGKDGDYLYNTNDSHINTLILIAPEGKIFSVQGEQYDIRIQNYQSVDRLTIYDGATTTDPTLVNIDEEREEYDGMPFVTTGNIIRFDLFTEDPDMYRDNGLNLTVSVTTPPVDITLPYDDSLSEQSNTNVITSNNGLYSNVTLDGRTLYKDGTWNTLCLPFDIDEISSSLLRGASVKTLESSEYNNGALTLTFADASSIEAGKPYIVKWDVDLSYNVIEGTDGDYYNYYRPSNLFDGTRDEWSPVENDGAYCIFEASEVTMAVTGYTITTGYSNPQAWTLEGKLNEGDEWTLIDSRDATTTPADALPNGSGTEQYYSAANPGTYHYFRFLVTKGGEEDDYGDSSFSLSELTLQGDFTPVNLENPTFNYVTIKNEQHTITSNGVTFAGNYGITGTNGLMLDEHNLLGYALHASLSITDPTAATGYSFEGWCTDAGLTTPATAIPFDATTGNVTLYAKITENVLELANAADNSDNIQKAASNGGEYKVTLTDRTLWKDGDWNTLCLPFNLSAAQIAASDLADAEIRTLSSASLDETGTLTLTFTPATGEGAVTDLVAGTPYIIKWTKDDGYDQADPDTRDLINLEFNSVTINATTHNQVCELGDGKSISFVGTYSSVVFDAGTAHKDVLFLGGGSSLYYPDGTSATTINACRGYFQLKGITAGDPNDPNAVKAFVLNFGDDETTDSLTPNPSPVREGSAGAWYDISGRKVSPSHNTPSYGEGRGRLPRGIYIHNGKKVVIK